MSKIWGIVINIWYGLVPEDQKDEFVAAAKQIFIALGEFLKGK